MNIYVGNIPWSTSEEELETHFAQFGNVNAVRIITEGHSGRSKGFGFVEMESKEAGQAAIEALDGVDFGEEISESTKPNQETNCLRKE